MLCDAIRAEIAKIPASELCYAKPSRILPLLEAAGVEITPSVRSATSKLLLKAKEKFRKGKITANHGYLDGCNSLDASRETNELAMRLVEACDGNFEIVRAEIARLEQFAKRIKGNI